MFKFNFNVDDTNENINQEITENRESNDEHKREPEEEEEDFGTITYEELQSSKTQENEIEFKRLQLDNETFIDYIDSYRVKMDENDLLTKINQTHDLVPGKYEGGLKVWELSVDLAHFVYDVNHMDMIDIGEQLSTELKSIKEFFNRTNRTEFNILELGCGHALPSLAIIKYLDQIEFCSKKQIIFNIYLQDFNKQIVENVTYENVKQFLAADSNERIKKSFHFVWGDWGKLNKDEKILPKDYFNLILTSETIYNIKNYSKLLNLFQKCLLKNLNEASLDSFVLLSAKTYYFGCGGNLHEFLNVAKSNDYKFNFTNNLLLNANYTTSDATRSDDHSQNDYTNNSDFKSSINSNSYTSSLIAISSRDSSIAKEIIKLYI